MLAKAVGKTWGSKTKTLHYGRLVEAISEVEARGAYFVWM